MSRSGRVCWATATPAVTSAVEGFSWTPKNTSTCKPARINASTPCWKCPAATTPASLTTSTRCAPSSLANSPSLSMALGANTSRVRCWKSILCIATLYAFRAVGGKPKATHISRPNEDLLRGGVACQLRRVHQILAETTNLRAGEAGWHFLHTARATKIRLHVKSQPPLLE